MRTIPINFKNKTGRTLAGRLEMPVSGKPFAYAIFAHCFTCSKSSKAAVAISRSIAKENIAVLRFDFTGLGNSEGSFSDSTFSSDAEDIVAAAEYLRQNHLAPQLLIGHSLGGTASLIAAHLIPEVNAVCTLASPANPDHVIHLFKESLDEIKNKGKATIEIGGRPFQVTQDFVQDILSINMEQVIEKFNGAFLFLHSPVDHIVSIDNASNLFHLASHPKSFISLDHADHLISDNEDGIYAGNVISAWAGKYLQGNQYDELTTDKQAVVRIGTEKYYTEILAGKHSLVADEPKRVGGKDLGPTPYDFLVTSLGVCTAMTLRMYADHKGWPLDEVFVHLQHSKDHKKDSEEDSRLDSISREIKLEGALDDSQIARLIEIADRCPVHKSLENGINIETSKIE